MQKRQIVLLLLTALLVMGCTGSQTRQPTECDEGFRLFDHPQLEGQPLCIPDHPERIAALDPFTFEAMVALDAPLVATPGIYINELLSYSPQFEAPLQDVTDTGIPIDIEALLGAQPDIILCRRTACNDQLRRLRQVAPVVIFDNQSAADWQESARFFAEVIGMEEEMARVEADYAARTNTMSDALDEQPVTISVMRVQPGRLRLYFERSFAGIVLADAGFTHPEGQAEQADARVDDEGRPQLANISDEQLMLLEADYAFVYTTETTEGSEAEDYLDDLRSRPTWASLDVVQRDDLHVVGTYWFASGYIAAHQMLDDLSDIVFGSALDDVNPFESDQ